MKNKTTTLLLSALIAFGMWLYVITVENPNQVNTYYNIPVVLEGESVLTDRGLMLVSDPDMKVRLDLKSNRTNLNNINSENITLKADLTDIYSAGEHQLNYSINYPGNVSYSDVKVVNKQPNTVKVVIAERERNEIPVVVSFIGKVKENFIMDPAQMTLDNETVTVEGPKEVVDQIHHAAVIVDCNNRTETISESYRFILQDKNNEAVDAALIKTSVEQIRVEVPIAATKRIALKLNVNAGGGASEENSSIVLDPAYVDVSGSDTALQKLDELVVGTINLGDIPEDTEKTFPITLPEGLTNLSGVTEVKATISFPDLAAKEFTITQIQPVNVPEGMKVELLTKQLNVMVRGLKDDVQKLQPSDITLQIDLTNVENVAAVEPVVIFAEPYQNMGVVGKYSISVTVSEADSKG